MATTNQTVVIQGLPLYLKDLAVAALLQEFPNFGEGEKAKPAAYVAITFGEFCNIANIGNVPKPMVKLMEMFIKGLVRGVEKAPAVAPVPETA